MFCNRSSIKDEEENINEIDENTAKTILIKAARKTQSLGSR